MKKLPTGDGAERRTSGAMVPTWWGLPAAPRRLLAPLALALSLASSPPVLADEVTERIDRIETQVSEAEGRIGRMSVDLTQRAGLIGGAEALARYEDAVYDYILGQHDRAAKEFFTLIESGALGNSPEFGDAQWYLAECLFELGSYALAEEAYQVMIDAGPQHPFWAGSVRRLLEIYGITGDGDAFYRLYNQYIVSNRVQPSDVVRYTLAKSFYRQGEYARAKSQLDQVDPAGSYYARARYLLGTVLVVEGNYNAAIDEFRRAAEVVPETVDEREVVDLAHLALGRLYYEVGQLDESLEYYQRVGRTSAYFSDALYEMTWTAIKAEQYQQALQSVEIFLLAFPEHRYTAQLKLDQGHLYRKVNNNDNALNSYQAVVDEYGPILEDIADIRAGSLEARDWFTRLAAADDLDRFYGEELPVFALELLINDAEVSQALQLYRELERQRAEIDASKAIIAEIEAALAEGSVNTVQRGTSELAGIELDVVRLMGELLYAEEAWLMKEGSDEVDEQVRALRQERDSANQRVATGADNLADPGQLRKEYLRLRGQLATLRDSVQSSDKAVVTSELDALWARVDRAARETDGLQARAGGVSEGELDSIRRRLAVEKGEVAMSDASVSTQIVEMEQLSDQVTRAGFARLGETFAVSILEADRGLVDVYWSELIKVRDQREAVQSDRKALLDELDAQFKVIRQSLPPEPDAPSGGQGVK